MPTTTAPATLLPRALALVLGVFGFGLAAPAQVLTPVTWTHAAEVVDGKTYLVHAAEIEGGWSVYSQYLASDDGPVRTEVTYEELSGATPAGRGEESGGRVAGFDEIFDMEVVKFERTFVIRQEVADFTAGPVSGYLTYMACDKTQCLPPTDVEFEIAAPVGAGRTGVTPAPKAALDKAAAKAVAAARSTRAAPRRAPERTPERAAVAKPPPPLAADTEIASVPTDAPLLGTPREAPTDDRAPVADTDAPVTWRFEVSPDPDGVPAVYHLVATATVAPGWNIYSQDSDEGGPIPTTFAFERGEGYTLKDGIAEVGRRKTAFDEDFGVTVAKLYGPEVRFEQLVTVTDAGAVVTGYLEYMACDQTQCLPPADVSFTYLPVEGYRARGHRRLGGLTAAGRRGHQRRLPHQQRQ